MIAYRDPQAAARAWAAENGWEVEDDTFYLTMPAEGRRKAYRRQVGCGNWVDLASGLMRSDKIRKTDEGWVIVRGE